MGEKLVDALSAISVDLSRDEMYRLHHLQLSVQALILSRNDELRSYRGTGVSGMYHVPRSAGDSVCAIHSILESPIGGRGPLILPVVANEMALQSLEAFFFGPL